MALPGGFGSAAKTAESLAFKLPDRIKLDDYPTLIRDFRKHILGLKKDQAIAKREMDNRQALLRKADYTRLGSNKEERDAAFTLHLEGDELFRSVRDDYEAQGWAIDDAEFELNSVLDKFSVAKLRFRAGVVSAELFGGIPVEDAETTR
jgi:hypothetical protein